MSVETLYDVSGMYGDEPRQGIISEHLELAIRKGLLVHYAANGAAWVRSPQGGPAMRVLCSEVVWMYTEDGREDGRCGRPVAPGDARTWTWCPAHDLGPDYGKNCEHGLNLALCAGPAHYPADRD